MNGNVDKKQRIGYSRNGRTDEVRRTTDFTARGKLLAVAAADKVCVLVDYAGYYQALHAALSQAQHSIFIIGWDIDSRLDLLRGPEAQQQQYPPNFFDLIHARARDNPDLQIYLNKWDYSFFFAQERERHAGLRWRRHKPKNIHYTLDCKLPFGACHHQKIVVVDDALAFVGGMDIATNRWDRRSHHPFNPDRADPTNQGEKKPFDPYHDLQIMFSGEAARAMGDWARQRWKTATGKTAVEMAANAACPWPAAFPVQFANQPLGLARTMPELPGQPSIDEIKNLILAEIEQAEKFIYIENQFLTVPEIASTLHRQLRRQPALRILALSCDRPKGVMEKKSMWTGRLIFRDILTADKMGERATLAYPVAVENAMQKPVRIHSKLMIVDDRFLHLGSANFNNRSMGLDSEFDVMIEANEPQQRARIAAIRNDLIREHTGFSIERIEEIIQGNLPVNSFLDDLPSSTQHLRAINDEEFRREKFARMIRRLADPERPLIPSHWTIHKKWRTLFVIALIVACILAWKITPLSRLARPEKIAPFLRHLRQAPWGIPAIFLLYIAAGLTFFPIAAVDLSIIMAFGFPWGPALVLSGVCLSASAGFGIGKITKKPAKSSAPVENKIATYIDHITIPGMAILRMTPVAPFNVVNFAIGRSLASYLVFLAGTVLGLLPGLCAMTLLRGPLVKVWKHPDPLDIFYLTAGISLWILVLLTLHLLNQRWRKRRG